MEPAPPLSVCIIGGGLGGLACGVALQAKGIACTLFEADDRLEDRKQGYGLTLASSERGPLAALGVLAACRRLNVTSRAHWVFDGHGRVRGYYGRAFLPSRDNPDSAEGGADADGAELIEGANNLRVSRQQLRTILLEQLQPGTIRWGARLASFHEDEQGVEARFQDGTVTRADVLVGADGVWSAVRRHKDSLTAAAGLPVAPLAYLDVAVIIGISPFRHPLLDKQGFYAMDGAQRLFTMPYEEAGGETDATMWQLSMSAAGEEGEKQAMGWKGDSQAALAYALTRADRFEGDLGNIVRELVQATPVCDTWGGPLYDRTSYPALPRKGGSHAASLALRSRVTVLGDACHPMSMFKGQGANQALADGPLLAHWLSSKGKNIATKLRCFEQEMVQRAGPRARASREAAQVYHSPRVFLESTRIAGFPGDPTPLLERLSNLGVTAGTACLEQVVGRELRALSALASAASAAEAVSPLHGKRARSKEKPEVKEDSDVDAQDGKKRRTQRTQ